MRYVQFGDRIERALILTCDDEHALLLTIEPEEFVATKAGFASGYSGTGPKCFAYTILILEAAGTDIDEVVVGRSLFERLNLSALTTADLSEIEVARRVRPMRWFDYAYAVFETHRDPVRAWRAFAPVMPWGVIDARIVDLAAKFLVEPDHALTLGYRRLEDTLRSRTRLAESSTKLISQCFAADGGLLTWDVPDRSEQIGRLNLFLGAFMALRNPRAHRELEGRSRHIWIEFLLLNTLFALEAEAIPSKTTGR